MMKSSIIQIIANDNFFSAKSISIFIYKNESLNVDGITVKTIHAFYVQLKLTFCFLDFSLNFGFLEVENLGRGSPT